ncbi:MAG: hypothetical protein COV52_00830 [Gammaproteobacteria bacterium CG11_big_fil_rev_8_21_14_0_20_46_22]|nr:MAG: hypothetical protein COV52_00830 [Gammaproteobacteria bacterium CG11_big_fil_rev_8_21_14_0_20_46_22]
MRLFKMTIMGLMAFGAVGTVFANSSLVKAGQYMNIHLASTQPEGFKFSTAAESGEHYSLTCSNTSYSYPVELFHSVKGSDDMVEQTIQPGGYKTQVMIDPFEPNTSGELVMHLKLPSDLQSATATVECRLKWS